MKRSSFKKVLIIGASRGLGHAMAQEISKDLSDTEHLSLVSRKIKANPEIESAVYFQADMSQEDGQNSILTLLDETTFDLIVYCAGGGPHGAFSAKDWKDHLWSIQVNLLAPLKILHHWLKHTPQNSPGLFVIVGSGIVETKPDPFAASYAAGKGGLFHFVESLQEELEKGNQRVWLFSPGYLDSQMLPATAKVRHDGSKISSVEAAAKSFLQWIQTDGPWHKRP